MSSDVYKIAVKLFVEKDVFGPTEFVPIFHRWIQTQAIENHLLIDVADYAHVPSGPGTLLVSSQANIHMDRVENRLGLLYVRKQPIAGTATFQDRLAAVLNETFKIAAKLKSDSEFQGRLRFRTDEISIRLNDRLLAPNTPATFASVKPDVESVGKELLHESFVKVEHYKPNPLTLLDVRIMANKSVEVSSLITALVG